MTGFTTVFGGTMISPSELSYLALDLDADVTMEWPLDASTGANIIARIVDITPSGPYTIEMPDATLTSTGNTIFFNNLGPDDVDIVDADGGALLSLAQGEVWQIYLTDNTTAAGDWRVFQYGASTAQAQASALAGPGIVAIGSVLGQAMETNTIASTPYTIQVADRASLFVWTGALGTFNLPAAVTAGNNWFVNIRNNGEGDLTIDPNSSETINSLSSVTLQPGDSAVVATNGVEWWTIGLGKQAIFAFDYTAISVNGLSGTYTLSGSELNRISYKFTGLLAGDLTIILPATVQQYWMDNATTGGFVFGLKIAGGSVTTNITEGTRGIYYSNGVTAVKADTTSGVPLPLAVVDGGTGATSAAGARANLGAAQSGTNSDITSLTGLTTPLSIAQGGTAAITAAAARTSLSAAKSGANTDITSAQGFGNGSAGTPAIGPSAATTAGFHFTSSTIRYSFSTTLTSFVVDNDQSLGSVALGCRAKYDAGSRGIFIGASAGRLSGNMGDSVVVGTGAAQNVTPSLYGRHVFVGGGAVDCGPGSDYTVIIGYGAGYAAGSTGALNNVIIIGANASASAASVSNQITLGNSSIATLRCQVTTITAISDARDKKDFKPLAPAFIDFYNSLRPGCFTWNMRDGAKVGIPDFGFIAQDLQAAMESTGFHVPHLVDDTNPDKLEAGYGALLPVIVAFTQHLYDDLSCTKERLRRIEEGMGIG